MKPRRRRAKCIFQVAPLSSFFVSPTVLIFQVRSVLALQLRRERRAAAQDRDWLKKEEGKKTATMCHPHGKSGKNIAVKLNVQFARVDRYANHPGGC